MSVHAHARRYPLGYALPKKNILLLTCIDLRLMDEIVHFMEFDNLTNRYDQFALAGASLATQIEEFGEDFNLEATGDLGHFSAWNETLRNHIHLAIKLHQIKDVYIIEHRNCGAYEAFLKNGHPKTDEAEFNQHLKYAKNLCKQIKKEYKEHKLEAHSFLMDLRGNMDLLYSTTGDTEYTGLNIK